MKLLCRVLGVSRGGFYDYLRRRERAPDLERQEKLAGVKRLAEASEHTYGSRRMAQDCGPWGMRWAAIRPVV